VHLKGYDEKCFGVQVVLRRGEKYFSSPMLRVIGDGRRLFLLLLTWVGSWFTDGFGGQEAKPGFTQSVSCLHGQSCAGVLLFQWLP
jgi:hypothetical protein